MAIAFAAIIVVGVAAPFVAFAWAMKRQQCPHCGGAIEPDPRLVEMFTKG